MAIYHCSIHTFSRAKGHTVVAAAAYRARAKLDNQFLGRQENYSKRKDLAHTEIILPAGAPDWAKDPSKLWNAVEKKETRKNSTVGREFEISLPHELNAEQRQKLAHDISQKLVDRFGFAVQYSIHKPGKDEGVNHHVHILASTRKLEPSGFTDKTRELDDIKSNTVEQVREMVADTINGHLKAGGFNITVSHKSLADQHADALAAGDLKKAAELNRAPTVHIGKHPIKSLENTAHNQQIILGNIQGKREMLDMLKSTINPIELRKEAVQTLRNHYQQKLQNLQQTNVQGSAKVGATAGADAQGSTASNMAGGGEASVDGDAGALQSQIGDIEQQLSLLPPPKNERDYQRRGALVDRKAKLESQLKAIFARKGSGKSGVTTYKAPPTFITTADFQKQMHANNQPGQQQQPKPSPELRRLEAQKKLDKAEKHKKKAAEYEKSPNPEIKQKAWMENVFAENLEREAKEIMMPQAPEPTPDPEQSNRKILAYKPSWADKDKEGDRR